MTKRNAITISVIFHAALLSFLAIYFAFSSPPMVQALPPVKEPNVITATVDRVEKQKPEDKKKPLPIRRDLAKLDTTVPPIPLEPSEPTDIAIGPIDEVIDNSPIVIGDARPTSKVAPEYPEGAIHRGTSGKVIAILTVGPDGKVIAVEIESAAPEGVFERATIKALSKWTYAPQLVTNVSTDANRRIRVEVEFDLKDVEGRR